MNKGLAWTYQQYQEDYDALNAHWYYDWGCSANKLSDPEYVPMLVQGLPNDNLPGDYSGHVLVFNEPANPGIGGHPLEPEVGAQRVVALEARYPNAKLRIGGNSIAVPKPRRWLQDFQAEYERLTGDLWKRFHIHCYFETFYSIYGSQKFCYWLDRLSAVMDAPLESNMVGANWWVTECGFVDHSENYWGAFVQWMSEKTGNHSIYRYAAFTTRANGR